MATPALCACSRSRLLVAAPSRSRPALLPPRSAWGLADCSWAAVAAQLGYICVDTFFSAAQASCRISKAESSSVDVMR
jgi:hypothetical protein